MISATGCTSPRERSSRAGTQRSSSRVDLAALVVLTARGRPLSGRGRAARRHRRLTARQRQPRRRRLGGGCLATGCSGRTSARDSRLAPVRRILILAVCVPRARRLRRQVGRPRTGDGRRHGSDDAAGEGRPGRRQAGLRRPPAARAATRSRTPARPGRSARTSTRRSRRPTLVVERVTNGKGVMPSFSGQLTPQQIADVAAYVVQATTGLILPDGFPRGVQAIACDLDRTLIGRTPSSGRGPAPHSRAASSGRDPRDPRHRADVPLGAPVRDARRDRRSGRLLPGRGRRRPGQRDAGCATSRSRSSSRVRRSRAVRGRGVSAQLLRRRRALRRRAHGRLRGVRVVPAPRGARGRRSPRLAGRAADEARRGRRPGRAGRAGGAAARPLRRAHVHLEVAAVLPRVREPGGDEGVGARVRRRAPRLHGGARRSPSATARTTSSCSSGPATASRSRTRTSACSRSPTSSARPCDEEGVAQVIEAYLARRHLRPQSHAVWWHALVPSASGCWRIKLALSNERDRGPETCRWRNGRRAASLRRLLPWRTL